MTVALEYGNLVRTPRLQTEVERSLPAIAVLGATGARRVERHASNWIFGGRASITRNEIAHGVAGWNHRAIGLTGRVRARHVNVPTFLNRRFARRVDLYAGR